jgi:hypothetical protein
MGDPTPALPGDVATRVLRLEDQLSRLATQVSVLATSIAPPEGSAPRTATSWFDVLPDQAPAVLRELAGWVDAVLLSYPEFSSGSTAATGLPPCWYRHPDVVEELLALRLAWLAAYRSPAARLRDAGDWHDRLPRTAERLVKSGGRLWRCIANQAHRVPPERSAAVDLAEMDDYATRWTRDRTAGRLGPG